MGHPQNQVGIMESKTKNRDPFGHAPSHEVSVQVQPEGSTDLYTGWSKKSIQKKYLLSI